MTVGDFFRNMKMFIWYVFTEPFRALKGAIEQRGMELRKIENPRYGGYVIFFAGLFFFLGGSVATGVITMFLGFVGVMINEYKRGLYIHRWREKKGYKLFKKTGGGNNDKQV